MLLLHLRIAEIVECLALADLGASINLMPLSIWRKLSLPELTPTQMILELADQSTTRTNRLWQKMSLTARALIDVYGEELTLQVSDEAITFKVGNTSRYSYNDAESINRIDVIDIACEEYSQEVLGFFDNSESGNPTPISEPIIAKSSPSLTPFEGGDFIVEEIKAYLANPYSPLPPMDLKCKELKSVKSSVDEPLELELKDLSSHLEYVFLEATNKLPVIIDKNLKDRREGTPHKGFKVSQASNCFRKDSPIIKDGAYTGKKSLISSQLATMDPLGDILVPTTPLRNSLIPIFIGRLFTEMPMTWSHGVTLVNVKVVHLHNRAWNIRHIGALKHCKFDLKTTGDHWKVQMNELNELRDQAYENSLIYKEKTKKIHDSKIKNRVFNVEPPRSIVTWEDLVSKFINQFFPPLKTTNLRNEITNFQQRFDESFCEAWERFKDLLRACPHHGFTELHEIDTFYNSLTSTDQDLLNATAGGNLLTKTPKDALTLIENKSKVRTLENRPVVSKVSTNTYTSGLSPDVAALTDAVKALLLKNTTPPPAFVKAVKESCVTCGGPHPLLPEFLLSMGLLQVIRYYPSNRFCSRHQGSGPLPCNTVVNPKGNLKAITTRSGVSYDGPPIPPPFSSHPKVVEKEPEEEYSQEVLGFSDNSESGNPTLISEPIISKSSPSLTLFEGEGEIRIIEEMLNNDLYSLLPLKDLKCKELKSIKSSVDEPPELELKDLPSHLEYAFFEGTNKLPVIIAKNLKDEEKERLIKVLKSHKQAIAWKLSDIKGINPQFCTHKILMDDDFKPAVQHQRRVNPKIHEVIKKEVIKLLDARLIYPILDSPWVSPVHCVPKKGGMTIVINEDNELILTRLMDSSGIFKSQLTRKTKRRQLVLNWEKCHFMVKEGIVLGHKISKSRIEVDREKVDVIAKLPPPTSPMTHLLEKETPFFFSTECRKAFENLKKKLTEAPILVAPDWDLPFEIMCDASDFAIGAVLGKRQTKHFQPIHYASKTMTDAQAHYTTTEKELLAVVYALEKFRPYSVLSKTIVYTDHSALKYLLAKQDAKPRLL
ncbi:reverse transcriptase domain-containing protein [Tanacetum coccineum]